MSFKRNYNILVTVLTILFLSSGCEKDVIKHDIDSEILSRMEEYNLPSVSACIIRNNTIVWNKSYGYRDIQTMSEATIETIYNVGSISKLMIVTAIMQLSEKGNIDIDKDIDDYLNISIRNPNFPESPITARMLLTHTAGIAWPNTYQEALGIWEHFEPDSAPRPSEWIPQFLIPSGMYYNPLIWKPTEPGKFELYSNIGSTVLAFLVEQISGMDFRQYCQENIFTPLEMSNTSYYYQDFQSDLIATLYEDDNSMHPHFDDRIYASGGLRTSVSDLSIFLIAYLNGGAIGNNRILKENTISQVFEIQNPLSGISLIWKARFGGWFGHTGGMVAGSASTAEIHPEKGIGLIIFTNKHNSTVYPGHEIYGLVRQKAAEFY
ncbi:serine hydrolase domain-containing protein [Bacteroidota bacterium]